MEENLEDEHLTLNILYFLPHNYSVDQIKKNEMKGISNTNFSRKARRGKKT